jgi:predicted PurR-regulated permease PerM
LAVQPAAQRVRLQVVLACCGAFFLCSPVCWSLLRRHCAPVWLVVLCVVVLAVLVVGLPVGLTTRQTMKVVQTSVQQAAC